MKKLLTPTALLALCVALAVSSCKKVDDPLVPFEASPVLVQIVDAPYQSDFSSEPTALYALSASVTLRARILKLDKTNLLDYKKGIDSVAVPNLKITLLQRVTDPKTSKVVIVTIGEATTDANGKVSFSKTWAEFSKASTDLGFEAPKTPSAALSWTGTLDGVTFTRLSKVQAK